MSDRSSNEIIPHNNLVKFRAAFRSSTVEDRISLHKLYLSILHILSNGNVLWINYLTPSTGFPVPYSGTLLMLKQGMQAYIGKEIRYT